jgi:hypothetical protein
MNSWYWNTEARVWDEFLEPLAWCTAEVLPSEDGLVRNVVDCDRSSTRLPACHDSRPKLPTLVAQRHSHAITLVPTGVNSAVPAQSMTLLHVCSKKARTVRSARANLAYRTKQAVNPKAQQHNHTQKRQLACHDRSAKH